MNKLIIYMLLAILIIPFSYAQTDFRTSVDIEELNSYVDYSFKLESKVNEFKLEIPKSSQIIYLRDDYGDINYNIENDTIFMNLLDSDKDRLILIKLKTETLISKKDNYFELIFESKNDGKITINLPDKVILNSIETNPKTEIKTYDEFSYAEFDSKQDEIFIVRYKTSSEINYWIYIVGILITLIITYFIYIRHRKNKFKQKVKDKSENEIDVESSHSNINQKINSNLEKNNLNIEINSKINKDQILKSLNLLNEKEKAVVEYVLNHEGCLQSDLQKEVGYSKSNLTKIIHKLEFRALIKKKNIGKINRLYLGEKINKNNET